MKRLLLLFLVVFVCCTVITGQIFKEKKQKVLSQLTVQEIKGKTSRINFYVVQQVLDENTRKWMG